MYDDLMRRLRNSAIVYAGMAALMPHSDGSATAKLFEEAADAIEELSVVVEGYRHRMAYGQGLEIANWHMNGDTEPFDNFYESAFAGE